MKIYLVNRFSIDEKVDKKNPPLSEEGIRQAKTLRLLMPSIQFDYCFSSPSISDYASAMLLVGDKVVIDRDKRLQQGPTGIVEKQIDDFLNFVEKNYLDKNILIAAEKNIIHKIKEKRKEAIVIKKDHRM